MKRSGNKQTVKKKELAKILFTIEERREKGREKNAFR